MSDDIEDFQDFDEDIFEDVLNPDAEDESEPEDSDTGEIEDPNKIADIQLETGLEKTRSKDTVIEVDESNMKTKKILQTNEIQALINKRVAQIAQGRPTTLTDDELKTLPNTNTLTIAVAEYEKRKLPLWILRPRPDRVIEKINPNELTRRQKHNYRITIK